MKPLKFHNIACVRGYQMVPLVGNIRTHLIANGTIVKTSVQMVIMVVPLIPMVQMLQTNSTIWRTPNTRIHIMLASDLADFDTRWPHEYEILNFARFSSRLW